MGEDRITILEACKILHRSEKQVRRHIKTGRLSGEIGQDGKYYIVKSEVEAMARHPDRMQVDKVAGHIERLDKRIDEIEKRLDTLATHVDEIVEALYSLLEPSTASQPIKTPTHKTKPTQPHFKAIPELPEGTLHFHDWLVVHNLKDKRRKILSYLENSRYGLKHEAYPKPKRPNEYDRYLTPTQQEGLMRWLKVYHPEVLEQ